MPVYVVDGVRYRVPLTSIFSPRTLCKDLLVTDTQRRARVAAKHNGNFWHTEAETGTSWTDIVGNRSGNNHASKWNRDDGRVLHQLGTRGISRKHFPSAFALSDSFIEELKDQLNQVRGDRLQSISKADRRTFWHVSNLSYDRELTGPDHLVSLSDPSTSDGKFEDDEFEGDYDDIGPECTQEDVTLLREIAAQWKKDQWHAISTRFNGMTGRKLTPEQAKSILDNHLGSNIHRTESSRSDGNRDRIRTKARPVHSVEWQLQR